MKKHLSVLAIIVLSFFCFVGCVKYSSSYSAVASVRTNTSDTASYSFSSFKGRMVFKLKCKADSIGQLTYSGKLDQGSLTVFIDHDNAKRELFSLKSGDSISSSVSGISKGTVYIIIETDGKCEEGSFRFDLK